MKHTVRQQNSEREQSDIYKDFLKRFKQNKDSVGVIYSKLARKYYKSVGQIYRIILKKKGLVNNHSKAAEEP